MIEQNAEMRVDMGGWFIKDADGNRLSLESAGRSLSVDLRGTAL